MPVPTTLTPEQELLLEQDYSNPSLSLRALAAKYGVDKKTIQRAAVRNRWVRDYGKRAREVANAILSQHANQIVEQIADDAPQPPQSPQPPTGPKAVVVDHPKRHAPRKSAPPRLTVVSDQPQNTAQPHRPTANPSETAPLGDAAPPHAPSSQNTSLDEMMQRFEEDVRAEVAVNIGRIQAAVTLRQLYETRQFHATFTIMQQLVLDWLGDDPEKRERAAHKLFGGGARTSIGHVIKQLADAMGMNAALERKIVGIVDQPDQPAGQPGAPVEVNVTQVIGEMPTEKLRVLNEALAEIQGKRRDARSLPVPPGYEPPPGSTSGPEEAPR
jgi:hypothetical protein